MKAYVEKSVNDGCRADLDAFAYECFHEDPESVRSKLIERVTEIVAALQEGNHIAYGISRKTFDAYSRGVSK